MCDCRKYRMCVRFVSYLLGNRRNTGINLGRKRFASGAMFCCSWRRGCCWLRRCWPCDVTLRMCIKKTKADRPTHCVGGLASLDWSRVAFRVCGVGEIRESPPRFVDPRCSTFMSPVTVENSRAWTVRFSDVYIYLASWNVTIGYGFRVVCNSPSDT